MPDTKDSVRKEIGKVVEDVGRMLRRTRHLTDDELRDLNLAIFRSGNALQKIRKIKE